MAETAGPNFASTVTKDDSYNGGYPSWGNENNAKANDNSYTYVVGNGEWSYANYLKLTAFGFSIPSSSRITGITVTIGRYGDVYSVKDKSLRLVKNSSYVGDDKADTSTTWPTSETAKTYGGVADLWGETWTPAQINDSNFGVALSAQMATTGVYARVDYIKITITYETVSAHRALLGVGS